MRKESGISFSEGDNQKAYFELGKYLENSGDFKELEISNVELTADHFSAILPGLNGKKLEIFHIQSLTEANDDTDKSERLKLQEMIILALEGLDKTNLKQLILAWGTGLVQKLADTILKFQALEYFNFGLVRTPADFTILQGMINKMPSLKKINLHLDLENPDLCDYLGIYDFAFSLMKENQEFDITCYDVFTQKSITISSSNQNWLEKNIYAFAYTIRHKLSIFNIDINDKRQRQRLALTIHPHDYLNRRIFMLTGCVFLPIDKHTSELICPDTDHITLFSGTKQTRVARDELVDTINHFLDGFLSSCYFPRDVILEDSEKKLLGSFLVVSHLEEIILKQYNFGVPMTSRNDDSVVAIDEVMVAPAEVLEPMGYVYCETEDGEKSCWSDVSSGRNKNTISYLMEIMAEKLKVLDLDWGSDVLDDLYDKMTQKFKKIKTFKITIFRNVSEFDISSLKKIVHFFQDMRAVDFELYLDDKDEVTYAAIHDLAVFLKSRNTAYKINCFTSSGKEKFMLDSDNASAVSECRYSYALSLKYKIATTTTEKEFEQRDVNAKYVADDIFKQYLFYLMGCAAFPIGNHQYELIFPKIENIYLKYGGKKKVVSRKELISFIIQFLADKKSFTGEYDGDNTLIIKAKKNSVNINECSELVASLQHSLLVQFELRGQVVELEKPALEWKPKSAGSPTQHPASRVRNYQITTESPASTSSTRSERRGERESSRLAQAFLNRINAKPPEEDNKKSGIVPEPEKRLIESSPVESAGQAYRKPVLLESLPADRKGRRHKKKQKVKIVSLDQLAGELGKVQSLPEVEPVNEKGKPNKRRQQWKKDKKAPRNKPAEVINQPRPASCDSQQAVVIERQDQKLMEHSSQTGWEDKIDSLKQEKPMTFGDQAFLLVSFGEWQRPSVVARSSSFTYEPEIKASCEEQALQKLSEEMAAFVLG